MVRTLVLTVHRYGTKKEILMGDDITLITVKYPRRLERQLEAGELEATTWPHPRAL